MRRFFKEYGRLIITFLTLLILFTALVYITVPAEAEQTKEFDYEIYYNEPTAEPPIVYAEPYKVDDILPFQDESYEPVKESFKPLAIDLATDIQEYIFQTCESYNISSYLVLAMIEQESQYTEDSVGDNGNSYGLMQIQPKWHQARMDKLNVTDLLDPEQNILVGCDFLAELFEHYDDVGFVLLNYNGGPSYANRMVEQGKMSKYVEEVTARALELESEHEKGPIGVAAPDKAHK